ncbi:hypothetical protein LCGC14_0969520 [marine sediment metagenome]|uniref:Uncharacterized protein n=1 Tax=marine sediment metagenome TaxID=412755 RepID=A0A0F9NGJ4_9ZZZZ
MKDKGVSVKLHTKFFDEIFEPARRELEKQTGVRVGQISFTKFLAKNKIQIKLPKQKFNLKNKSPIIKFPLGKGFKLI